MPYGLRLRRRLRYNVCETALIFLFWALLGTETQNSKKFINVNYVTVIQLRTGCNVTYICIDSWVQTAMVSPFRAEGKGSQATTGIIYWFST